MPSITFYCFLEGSFLHMSLGQDMIGTFFKIIDKVLTFFEEWTLFITITAALLALFANVVLRYGFDHSLAWSEELVRDVIIYTTFVGCSAAVKNRSMIKIDASVQLIPMLKKPLTWFANVVTLGFAVLMVVYGIKMSQLQLATHQKSIIMQIPLVYLYLILPVSGGMMLIRTLQVMYEDLTADDNEAEEIQE